MAGVDAKNCDAATAIRLTEIIPATIPSVPFDISEKRNCRKISVTSAMASRIHIHIGTDVVSGNRRTGKQNNTLTRSVNRCPRTNAGLREIFPK
jgi:hypothetical protein